MTSLKRTAQAVRPQRLQVNGQVERLTHYLFRYPAKFHPPVVRELLDRYTNEGDLVLDPFCGSGTLMVEAAATGRDSVGIDVDPVAIAVAKAKIHRYNVTHLRRSAGCLRAELRDQRRPTAEYAERLFVDLTDDQYDLQADCVSEWVPSIPNLFHWFRRYVIIDLALIRRAIAELAVPATHRHLFEIVFASIIRASSNADPVPVSGLEVTSYMKKRDAKGRLIDPFALYEKALARALDACGDFSASTGSGVRASAKVGDATKLDKYVQQRPIDAVLCSPPYHGAVDYYRRHQLEMFWLGSVRTTDDRLALLHQYVGRPKVPQSHPFVVNGALPTKLAAAWETRIRAISEERADAFRHYLTAMGRFFQGLAGIVRAGTPAMLVVGHSTWNHSQIPTTNLFSELAREYFELERVWWYPVKNRYMSYARRNGASIDREYVLVLRRTARPTPRLMPALTTENGRPQTRLTA